MSFIVSLLLTPEVAAGSLFNITMLVVITVIFLLFKLLSLNMTVVLCAAPRRPGQPPRRFNRRLL